ncbi:MAG: hypothetical protein V1808_02390 [Candidatus Daviesbacteria bacterium]
MNKIEVGDSLETKSSDDLESAIPEDLSPGEAVACLRGLIAQKATKDKITTNTSFSPQLSDNVDKV